MLRYNAQEEGDVGSAGEMPLKLRGVRRFKNGHEYLRWLRFEGVHITLFEERLALPPRPKPPPAEGEEEGEAEGGGRAGEQVLAAEEEGQVGGEGEGEPREPARVYEVTRLGVGLVDTQLFVDGTTEVGGEVKLMSYNIADDIVRPLDDRDTEKALDAIRRVKCAPVPNIPTTHPCSSHATPTLGSLSA